MSSIEPFPERLKRLAKKRGKSVSQVGHDAWDHAIGGTSSAALNKVMGKEKRRPNPAIIEGVARVLEVDPSEFPEYRLAKLREALDERVVGLDQAVATGDAIEAALAKAPASVVARGDRGAAVRRLRDLARSRVAQQRSESLATADDRADSV